MEIEIINLKNKIGYQKESIVSKTLFKNSHATITLFAFDKDQAISEHKAPFEVFLFILEGECKNDSFKERILFKRW